MPNMLVVVVVAVVIMRDDPIGQIRAALIKPLLSTVPLEV